MGHGVSSNKEENKRCRAESKKAINWQPATGRVYVSNCLISGPCLWTFISVNLVAWPISTFFRNKMFCPWSISSSQLSHFQRFSEPWPDIWLHILFEVDWMHTNLFLVKTIRRTCTPLLHSTKQQTTKPTSVYEVWSRRATKLTLFIKKKNVPTNISDSHNI
jgi:hypothetical protein